MYLSRLTLNPANAQVRREIAYPYEMHRTLSHAFAQGTFDTPRASDAEAAVMFRVDERPRERFLAVLVQSKTAPDWTFLNDKRDGHSQRYLVQPGESKAVALKVVAGQILGFRLRANPTRRLGTHARDENGKRVGIYDDQGQMEWLQRKAAAGGFSIVRVTISRDERIADARAGRGAEGAPKIALLAVQFDGILRVADADLFVRTVEAGIGSAKGFGFGLLSLARA